MGGHLRCIFTATVAVILIAACAGERPSLNVTTTEIIATVTSASVVQAPTDLPTPQITPTSGPVALTVWWPESFAPQDNNQALTVLAEQINDFQASQGSVVVNMRLKKESDVGGIMATLLTASAVAPGALPDLTLIRRRDLLDAAQARVIYPLEGKISSAVVGDLYDSALQLGQVDGTLYGVPYTVEVQHLAYHAPIRQTTESWTFASILSNEMPFVFAAGQTEVVNNVFLAQYFDAGGTLTDGSINERALFETLSFYEDAFAAGIIDPAIVNYASSASYVDLLLSGEVSAGVVTSSTYLRLLEEDATLDFAPIPTASGRLISEVDGWMWVLTTSSADRQALASQYLNWMLNASRQGQLTTLLQMLPSQRTALQQWESTPYTTFARDLLTNSILPQVGSSATVRAMQNALVAVLTGQNTAAEATQAVVNQLGASGS